MQNFKPRRVVLRQRQGRVAHGQRILGLAVFVVAKVVGTALLARIFALTKPQLLTIGWFRWCYEGYSHWKARLFAYVRAMPSYQRAKAWASAIKAGVRQWWQRHFRHADETKVNPHE